MLRRPLSATVSEENAVRSKAIDAVNAGAGRPTTRAALGDIKNRDQDLIKRTSSLKVGTKVESKSICTKIEPRRPLRATANVTAKLSTATVKNSEQNQSRSVLSSTALASKTAALSVSTNSTLNSTATAAGDANSNKLKSSASFNAGKPNVGGAPGKPRLVRSNATSSLQPMKMNTSDATKSMTSEVQAEQSVAMSLVTVKEENENTMPESPDRDNAYSSSMMPNIDAGDEENPQLVTAYVNDIYGYMRKLEKKQSIRENFLEGKEVNGRMRSILIDWLSQVHIRFHLLPETLYMTVALIDRFLEAVAVPKDKLQLVGVTAMFIASKYEEMYAPEIGDFSYITDHSCTKQDIRAMECLLLRTLGFNLGRPLPIHFLRRYSKAAEADPIKHTMGKYFLELALVHYTLSHFAPSMLAAASLWLSLKLLDRTFEWTPVLVYYTQYREADFMSCLRRLCRAVLKTHTNEVKQQAIRNKFATSKFMEISKHAAIDLALIRKLGEP